MGASQDYFNNSDGFTTVYTNDDNSKLHDYFGCENQTPKRRDITHGLKLFFEDGSMNSYTVQDVYTQPIYGFNGKSAGFTFNDFKAEIDAGRPVIINFAGHSTIGIGYNVNEKKIAMYDTWSTVKNKIKWGDPIIDSHGNSYAMQSVTVVILNGTILKSATNGVCKVGILTGIYDNVTIKNPPANTVFPPLSGNIMQPNTYTFSPGNNIRFYAEFNSGYCDTYAWTFNWEMKLYHKSGTYEYMTATTQGYDSWPTYCKSFSQWETTASSNIPNLEWERNEDGSINGKLIVETVDNNGYVNTSDEVFVNVFFAPNAPKLEIVNLDENSITVSMKAEGAESYRICTYNPTHQGSCPINTDFNVISLSNWQNNDVFTITAENEYGSSYQSVYLYNKKFGKIPYSTSFVETQFPNWNFANSWMTSERDTSGGRTDNNCIEMDANYSNTQFHNIADLYLDLCNEKSVYLKFWLKDYSDENHEKDGIYLSVDGGCNFQKIYSLVPQSYTDNVWKEFTLNISSLAENFGLKLSKYSIIRFSHEDDYPIPSDGFLLDDVSVYTTYTPPSSVITETLSPTKDALLLMNSLPGYEYIANTNYGSYPMIKADEWTYSGKRTNSKSVFQFDLAKYPTNALVKSAHLSLYANNPQSTDDYKQMSNLSTNNLVYKTNACWLKRIIQEWDENTVTYNTEPQTTTENVVYLPISESYTQNYLDIDVTKLVLDMIKYPGANYGFMLGLVDEIKYTRMAFASSNHSNSSLHPKLTVEYYFDEQVYTIPFTVSGSTISEYNNWDVQGGDGKDKAYLVYVPSTITINATTCASGTNYDTKLEIFKANGITTGFYNDDYSCSYNNLTSSLNGKTLVSGYYYFVVDGYNGASGNFQLSVSINNTLKSTGFLEESLANNINVRSLNSEIKVYPNPIKDELFVILPKSDTQLNIIDMNGRILKTIQVKENQHIIDCSDMNQGVYVIKIISKEFVETRVFEKVK